MKTFKDFDSIERALRESADILSVEMGHLRDACGAGRLGKYVVAAIDDELDRRGIGHQPAALPNNQHDSVRLYKRGTRVADVIQAVESIGEAKADAFLRDLPQSGNVRLNAAAAAGATAEPMGTLIRSLDRAEARPGHTFVALKWFRDVALAAENVEWSALGSTADAAIRDAIQRRLVLTSKVPNPVKPDFPVTSIRLNRSAPEVREALRSTGAGARFQPIALLRNGPLSRTIVRDRR